MNRVVSKSSPEYASLRPSPALAASPPKEGATAPRKGRRAALRNAPANRVTERKSRENAERLAARRKELAVRRKKLFAYGMSALLAAVLCVGNLFLADIRSDWYGELAKPVYCPPLLALYLAYIAGVVLLCAGYAQVLIRHKGLILRFEYLFNALLQVLWTLFFFRLRAVFAALIVLALLVLHTFFLLKYTRKAVGNIAFLLLGHLVRIVFCILLNYSILVLN